MLLRVKRSLGANGAVLALSHSKLPQRHSSTVIREVPANSGRKLLPDLPSSPESKERPICPEVSKLVNLALAFEVSTRSKEPW
jgi:hypothetical protein